MHAAAVTQLFSSTNLRLPEEWKSAESIAPIRDRRLKLQQIWCWPQSRPYLQAWPSLSDDGISCRGRDNAVGRWFVMEPQGVLSNASIRMAAPMLAASHCRGVWAACCESRMCSCGEGLVPRSRRALPFHATDATDVAKGFLQYLSMHPGCPCHF